MKPNTYEQNNEYNDVKNQSQNMNKKTKKNIFSQV